MSELNADDDSSGIPRKNTAKERKQERDSTRVYLLTSFSEWQRQKGVYEERIRSFQEASSFSSADLKSKRTHEQFAEHLLEMHAHLCHFCRCVSTPEMRTATTQTDSITTGRRSSIPVRRTATTQTDATTSPNEGHKDNSSVVTLPLLGVSKPKSPATSRVQETPTQEEDHSPQSIPECSEQQKAPGMAATCPSELAEAELFQQGAEARVYTYSFYGKPCIIKERFKKTYRHPLLEERLTRKRVSQEVKALLRCKKAGIAVPAVYFVDSTNNCIYLENLGHTLTIREFVHQYTVPFSEEDNKVLSEIATKIGSLLAKIHAVDVVHGDLTTSNMLLQSPHQNSVVYLIDFGLSQVSHLAEDKGVDLYVLEKAFLSTHPNTEHIFTQILNSYKENYKKSAEVLKKLEEVRLRGRKREMVG